MRGRPPQLQLLLVLFHLPSFPPSLSLTADFGVAGQLTVSLLKSGLLTQFFHGLLLCFVAIQHFKLISCSNCPCKLLPPLCVARIRWPRETRSSGLHSGWPQRSSRRSAMTVSLTSGLLGSPLSRWQRADHPMLTYTP